MTGVQISDYRKRRPDLMRQCFAEVFDPFVAGAIRPMPVQVYALEDYARRPRRSSSCVEGPFQRSGGVKRRVPPYPVWGDDS